MGCKMKCVECPHCGQMQMLDDSNKCIKCGKEISSYGSTRKNIHSKIYICPKCGRTQIDKSDYCEKCKASMLGNDPVLSVISFIFGFSGAISFALCCVNLIHSFNSSYSWRYDESIKNAIISGVLAIIFLILCIKFFKSSKKNAKLIEKHMQTIFDFTNCDGISDIDFNIPGKMEMNLDTEQIIFTFGPNIKRTLSFSQVKGIFWGNYRYQETKPIVGGVSVGGVFLHESPISTKTSPFFGIKYTPSQWAGDPQEIKVIFEPGTNLGNLHGITAWIGFPFDNNCIVSNNKQL